MIEKKLAKKAVKIANRLIKDPYKEHFIGIYLNKKYEILGSEVISIGTLTAGLAHPREVLRPALVKRAFYVLVLHNHPSGNLEPSEADLTITKILMMGCELLGLRFLDHLIISGDEFRGLVHD